MPNPIPGVPPGLAAITGVSMATGLPLNVPVPDPSERTAIAITLAIAALREIFEARLDAMDHASFVLAETVNRVPTVLDREVARIRELSEFRFSALDESAKERWSAYVVATTKAEAAVTKQFDSIQALLASGAKSTDEKIASISARLDRNEGASRGGQQTSATLLSIVVAAATVVGVIVAWIVGTHTGLPH